MSERILITGAQGFLGRYLIHDLLRNDADIRVLGIGRSSASLGTFTHTVRWGHDPVQAPVPSALAQSALDPRYEYREADVCDGPAVTLVIREFQPTAIVHLAGALRDDPVDRLIHHNIAGVVRLLQAVDDAAVDASRIVLGSSGSVYGAAEALPIREDAPCVPVDPYATTKRAGEEMARVIGMRRSLPILIARIFNPMGPGQDERHLCGGLCAQLAAIRAGLMPAVLEVGALDTTRDFVDATDVARALTILVRGGEPGRIYNVASGRETPVETIVNTAIRLSGLHNLEVRRLSGRPGDIPRVVAEISRLRALGFAVSRSIDDSLRDTLNYYDEAVRAASTTFATQRASTRDGVEV